MKAFNLSEWALRHRSVTIYLMIIAILAGLASYYRLGRAEDPQITISTMVVMAAWPGATIEETFNQVTERIERKLQETPKLDYLRSFTRAGFTTIFVEIKGEATSAELPDIWYFVRKSVADIRHTLPSGIVGPFFNDEFGDTFGTIYGFTADTGFTHRELRDYVEDARSRLLHVPDVSKIELLGEQDENIFVEFSMETLATLGLDRSTLISALQAQNIVQPAGEIETDRETISLRVSGSFDNENDIRNINFVAGGRMLRLSDIAKVHRGLVDPPSPLFRVNGKPAIGLAIAMRDGGDILQLGQNLSRAVDEITANLPVGIDVTLVSDQAVTVDGAISEFMTSLWQAVGIILFVSFISLGVRPGLIVATAIPLTLLVVFLVMYLTGIDMQRISLGALIIALALLVDDAMTTTDATLSRLAAGDEKMKAAIFPYQAYAYAMLAGTLVTIAGFVPIGFAASSAGEYTFSLFAVVGIALLVSWFVAVLFTPLFGVAILRAPRQSADGNQGFVYNAYRGFLTYAIKARWLTIAVTIGLFIGSFFVLPLIPRQFFPSSDRVELMVDLTSPQNASIFASEEVVKRFDKILAQEEDVVRWSSYVGRGAIRFYLPLNVQLPNSFFAQTVLIAKDVAARDRLQLKLEEILATEFPNVVGRVYPLELGPPVGWPVQYRVSGPEIDEVRSIALRLAEIVGRNPQAVNVNFDWMEPARQLRIHIDQDEARLLGLSSQSLANTLNTVVSGIPITQIRDDIYLVNVVVRASEDQRLSIDTLRNLHVPLPSGQTVPLSQFATFEYDQEQPIVWRRDRVPTLTVQADPARGILPEAVVVALQPAIDEFAQTLPAGYSIAVGGTVEESAESLASVIAVVPVMLLIMFTVLMFQLQSFQKLAIVLSVGPLGIIGVAAVLFLSNRPLGFVAILGILALLGMITKNAVILVGQIDAERASGKPLTEAVIGASSARFRPIMLTAVSTVLGMIPIAPTVFWGPMAFAIMGGLMVGTILTLIFLPALYVAWFDWAENRKGGKGKPAMPPSVPA